MLVVHEFQGVGRGSDVRTFPFPPMSAITHLNFKMGGTPQGLEIKLATTQQEPAQHLLG